MYRNNVIAAVLTAILCTTGCGTPEEGDMGEVGLVGPEGPQGLTGEAGPAGPRGATGSTGSQGLNGPAGSTGPAGPTGAAGEAGPAGSQGLTGPQGLQGPAGPTGSTGADGATGATGPQGPAGADGVDGAAGADSTTSFIVKDATGMEVPWVYEYTNNYYYIDQYDLKWRVIATDSGVLAPAGVQRTPVTTYFSGSSCSGSSAVPVFQIADNRALIPHGWNGPLVDALSEPIMGTTFPYNSSGNGVGCINTPGTMSQEWVEITFLSEGNMPDLSQYTMPFHKARPAP